MTPIEKISERLRAAGRDLRPEGSWFKTSCPAHNDSTPSLGIKQDPETGKAVVKCFAGCRDEDVLKAIGLEVRDLFPETSPAKQPGTLMLAQLADAKKLPLEFLRTLGLKDCRQGVVIPYFDESGSPARARLRLSLSGDQRFRWGFRKDRGGSDLKQIPYGLWRLSQARENGNLILVEGESDCWSGWYHNLNTLGLPGADTARLLQAEHLQGIKNLILVKEPDRGGEAFVNGVAARLKTIGFEGKACSFSIGSGIKDLSDLHIGTCDSPDIFREAVRAGVEMAEPLPEPAPKMLVAVSAPASAEPAAPNSVSSAQPQAANPVAKPELRNHEVFTYADKNGDLREGIKALQITKIGETLADATDNWPRRVQALLFSDENGAIRYLEDRDQLFAWVQGRMPVFWAAGADINGQSLSTKAEFGAHLVATAQCYASVEELPHEPSIDGHYYAWKPPSGYVPTGEYFEKLLSFFDNAETDSDRALIRAAFLTPAWGGLPGKRPAFAIMAPDRGCGKSTLAEVIGQLYGGHVELQVSENAEEKFVSRLLTPDSLTKRVVRIDNIKTAYSSELVESLITAAVVSGHRLYHGDARRPNTLTFLLTGNKLRLSRDIAERSFIIRLQKPPRRRGWDDAVADFVRQYQHRILADIVAELRKPPASFEGTDRWMAWVGAVLARATTDVDGVILFNQQRRGECDDDIEEAVAIMEAIDKHLAELHATFLLAVRARGEDTSDIEPEQNVFISATEMAEIVGRALNQNMSAKASKQKLEAHIEAGRLLRVSVRRTNSARGFDVRRQSVTVNVSPENPLVTV